MSNTELIKLTEEKIDSNDKLRSFISRSKDLANVICPETVQFSDISLKYGIAKIDVDPTNEKQVWKDKSSGELIFHLSKKKEFADAVGVKWSNPKIIERRFDEKGQVTYVAASIVGKLKSVDGSVKESEQLGVYDYFADKNNFSNETQIKKRRYKADQNALSNAQYRCLTDLLPKLRGSYKFEDLKKPFILTYVIEDKNELLKGLPLEDQILIKKKAAEKAFGISSAIYPSSPENNNHPALPESKQNQDNNNNIPDANFTDIPQGESGISHAEQNKIIADEFRNVPQKERTEKIMNLIKIKGWKHPKGAIVTATMIEKASVDDQIKRIEEMLNMPDEVEEEVSL